MEHKPIIFKYVLRMIFLIVLTGFPVLFYAQNTQQPIVFTGSNTSLNITDSSGVYIDEGASLSLKQVINLYKNKQFNKKTEDVAMYSMAAIWVSIPVDNKTNGDLVLEILPGIINNVSVFTLKGSVLIDSVAIGSTAEVKNKQILSRKIAFFVKPGKHDYFVRVQSNTYLPFHIALHSKNSFFKIEHIRNVVNGILFGAMVLSFLYNLLLFLSVRDLVYLHFSVFVFFGAIILAYSTGLFNHFVLYPVVSIYITVFYALFLIATLLFVISFLELKNTVVHKTLKCVMCLLALISVVDLSGFHFFANFSLFLFAGVIYSYIIIVVLMEGRRGNRPAMLFFAPWALIIFAYFLLVVQRLLLAVSINVGFDFIVYSGYANVVLLSLAVGNKINIYSKQKESARAKELIAWRERDSIISMQKAKLEKIVQERNKELIAKTSGLSAQQEEIEAQTHAISIKIKEINYINEQLQLKNKQIETQNIALEKSKMDLETIVVVRNKELKKAKQKAIVADTLKTSFLNNLSREIKLPMNAITGYSGLLINKALTANKRNEYLRVIIHNVHGLLSLIDDIVTLSRIQAGIIKLKFQEFSLPGFVASIADEFIEKLDDMGNKKLSIVTKIPEKYKKLLISSDYNKLWLIYSQLIENAIKYTEKGSVTIGFEISNTPGREKGNLNDVTNNLDIVFFVKDSGVGISNSDIDKYFVIRKQVINKHQFRKEGIGLAIVNGLVDLFKGEISVKNTNGTEVFIKINTETPSEKIGAGYDKVF